MAKCVFKVNVFSVFLACVREERQIENINESPTLLLPPSFVSLYV